mmetsp:Transcript_116407/g.184171  ORF Transcript_116407/g.184171 Transcript_116407/m.184171 type:complete len:282 (+) Transcript_116407:3-848(+)
MFNEEIHMRLTVVCYLAWPVFSAHFRRGHVSDLEADALFGMTWPSSGGSVHVAAEDCNSFSGQDFACFIESPEHALVRSWIPANATVMEFGGRFGTTTCEIAKKLNNSGRLVTVEPDPLVWRDLAQNLDSHNCHAHIVRGAISGSPLNILSSGYGGRSDPSSMRGGVRIPVFSFDDVEKASGLKVDTLLIDCEGCAQDMMDQLGPKIKSSINLILIEADQPDDGGDCHEHCMNYRKFFEFLKQSGFTQVDKFNDCDRKRSGAPEGYWCGIWINHYAFRRQK